MPVAPAANRLSTMNIAIVHDWLDTWGGGESALAQLLALYPDAEVFALVDFMAPADRARLGLGSRPVHTSFIQDLPGARTRFRRYLPLFPKAIQRLDLSRFDLVLSSSHAVAKGVRTTPAQLHICYCYTPMRYAWDLQESYLRQVGLDRGIAGWFMRRSLAHMRRWDARSATRVNHFVAISAHIADRIRRSYGRESTVIYPPVDLGSFDAAAPRSPVYVTVSRLVPYKRIDLIVAAFRDLPGHQLVVIGDGPERARIAALAGPNVRLLGQVTDAERDRWLGTARAFIFAAEEDFGIAPVEAQARGMPVIALGRGGVLETVRGLEDGVPTGVLFPEQTAAAITTAVRQFEAKAPRITAQACRESALRFSAERFRAEFGAFVHARLDEFAGRAAAR
jgi:glycosyltransferase involved in cell wall biosynthesis